MTAEQAAGLTERLAHELRGRRADVARLDGYYRGEQPLKYASPEWRKAHHDRYRDFSDNWCSVVANAPNERLRRVGIRLDDGSGDVLSELERRIMDDWQVNDMDSQSSQGWLESLVAKRSFVLVWDRGDGTPMMSWERPDEMIVATEPGTRRRIAALKMWDDGDDEHATLYTPEALWKWRRPRGRVDSGIILPPSVADGTRWEPREVDDEPWPLPNPLGEVPVVEMPNRPMLGGRPISDIDGTAAMQDAVNLMWAYLFAAADFASLPARVVMGQSPPKLPILDENGQKVGEREVEPEALTRGRMLWLTGQSTKIGQWEAAKLDAFTDVIEISVGHIAAQTRTPAHYLVNKLTNVPAEGFTALETGLVKKVEECQLFLSAAVRDVDRLGQLVRGDLAAAELIRRGTVIWRDAETHSVAQLADSLVKMKDIGFPFAYLAERWGLTPTEVARVVAMRTQETDAGLLGSLSDVFRAESAAAGAVGGN